MAPAFWCWWKMYELANKLCCFPLLAGILPLQGFFFFTCARSFAFKLNSGYYLYCILTLVQLGTCMYAYLTPEGLLWKLTIIVVNWRNYSDYRWVLCWAALPHTAYKGHCSHSQTTLFFFSMNSNHSVIGWGGEEKWWHQNLFLIQSRNALYSSKKKGVVLMPISADRERPAAISMQKESCL